MLPVHQGSRLLPAGSIGMSHSLPCIKRLALVGVGLIGGSFAMSLRSAGAVQSIVGIDANQENLGLALKRGIIDHAGPCDAATLQDVDVVFVAVPVNSIIPVIEELARRAPTGCIITDGGSVKAPIVTECSRLMPAGRFFVGGHPIAGTEHSGPAAAFSSLYNGRRCILTPDSSTDPNALETVSRLWQACGADVSCMDAERHDRIFAEISHLPHMAAYALVHAVGTADVEGENVLSYTAGGFRDFTRIASSDPAMWRDIALMNRQALLNSLDGFSASLTELRGLIEQLDAEALESFFTTAKKFRDGIL